MIKFCFSEKLSMTQIAVGLTVMAELADSCQDQEEFLDATKSVASKLPCVMGEPYLRLPDLINLIDAPNRECCLQIYQDNKILFDTGKGSACKHQDWEGGYLDHITEIMNIAVVTYSALNGCRQLPFSLSDALLTLYLHDIEKPWVYAKDSSKRVKFANDEERHAFNYILINQYGFKLTDDHKNAIRYVHGEGDDYDAKVRVQNPLAAFIHHCDNTSARIWYDRPKKVNDAWSSYES